MAQVGFRSLRKSGAGTTTNGGKTKVLVKSSIYLGKSSFGEEVDASTELVLSRLT